MSDGAIPVPEFSRPLTVTELRGQRVFELEADAGERAKLAVRFGLDSLDRFVARVVVRPVAGNVSVDLRAHFEADLVQTCVVTLEPVHNTITGDFDATFSPSAQLEEEEADSVDIDPEGPEPPEPIVNGVIDLGEVVAERLGLEIDPFPRAPGAEFAGFSVGEGPESTPEKKPNPFAALAKLRPQKN